MAANSACGWAAGLLLHAGLPLPAGLPPAGPQPCPLPRPGLRNSNLVAQRGTTQHGIVTASVYTNKNTSRLPFLLPPAFFPLIRVLIVLYPLLDLAITIYLCFGSWLAKSEAVQCLFRGLLQKGDVAHNPSIMDSGHPAQLPRRSREVSGERQSERVDCLPPLQVQGPARRP